MASPNQRKRPAPGASPSLAMHNMDQFPGTDAHLVSWNSPDNTNGFAEDGSQGIPSYGIPQVPAQFTPQMPATPSNMLARRQGNRALVPTGGRATFEGGSDPWSSSLVPSDTAALDSAVSEMNEQESLAQLEQQALKAKRDAEAKRKQIPPFVQKLSRWVHFPDLTFSLARG
ncbi:hypothetical protein IMZ48_34320 [Candidatus Bathyarchaeota archaeon]|nr:hypothetical protein [Candidatus Bathyarchaeota archaeon]